MEDAEDDGDDTIVEGTTTINDIALEDITTDDNEAPEALASAKGNAKRRRIY